MPCPPRRTILLCLFALAGCGAPDADLAAWQALPGERQQAANALYQERCATCHGQHGDGHGPSAMGIMPSAFSATDWGVGRGDAELREHIIKGSQQGMPPHPDLADDPRLGDLLLYLRRF